jgi:phage baseplate assembly protein W
LTNRNERVFNNGFGANLQSLLFSNTNSSLDNLSEILKDDIQQNFPQISIKQVKLSNDFDNNTIKFEMFYSFGARLTSLDVTEALNININLTEAVATNAVNY